MGGPILGRCAGGGLPPLRWERGDGRKHNNADLRMIYQNIILRDEMHKNGRNFLRRIIFCLSRDSHGETVAILLEHLGISCQFARN